MPDEQTFPTDRLRPEDHEALPDWVTSQRRPRLYASGQRWRRLSQRAASAISANDPPTATLRLREIETVADDRHARAVVDLATRVAALTLTTGGSSAEATAAALQVTHSYGLTSVHVEVSFSSVIVSLHRGADRDALTLLRTVPHRAPDYARLSELQAMLEDLPKLDVIRARKRFDQIVEKPRRYRPWVLTVAAAVLGVGVALLLGGGWREALLAGLAAAGVDLVHSGLSRRGAPEFFAQIAGAAVPTSLALVVTGLGTLEVPGFAGISPSMVVAAGVVMLLSGLSVVSGAQDAIDGFLLTAVARSFQVGLLTLGMVLGILGVLWAANLFGLPSYLNSQVTTSLNPLPTTLGALFTALGFAVMSQTRIKALWWCCGLGVLGWLGFLAGQAVGLGHGTSVGVGATVAAIVAHLVSRPARMAPVGLITAGVIALLPGGMVYRGLYGLSQSHSLIEFGPATLELIGAVTVGIGIAMGVTLGTWLGRFATRGRDGRFRFQRKALRHSAGVLGE
ncbi:threonine/serine ThrE exporter family protein [Propionibacteriaceae bacterium Y2011]|uniref:threonine/serine ThrE exporter family protein n=1 Tax=Microlunatus sp. Y2014 TaxID=3418488 RepID=UPI003B46A092